MNSYDHLFKLLLVGDSGVGKSSMITRFTDDSFSESYLTTIGVDYKIRMILVNDKNVKLQIWDTAGQERFRTITSTYYRGSNGIFVVFDISYKDSFENVEKWLDEVRKNAPDNVTVVLVGAKLDLNQSRAVSFDVAKAYADGKGIKYIETSSKSDNFVGDAFTLITEEILAKVEKSKAESQKKEEDDVKLEVTVIAGSENEELEKLKSQLKERDQEISQLKKRS